MPEPQFCETSGGREESAGHPFWGWFLLSLLLAAVIGLTWWVPYQFDRRQWQQQMMPTAVQFNPGSRPWLENMFGHESLTDACLP